MSLENLIKIQMSIIIPIYNAEETLEECLKGVSTCLNERCELILVDNNSTDRSVSLCEKFKKNNPNRKITIHRESKRGAAAARNTGASIAVGELLLFTDSDCIPSSNWIKDYISHFDDNTVGAVAGCIKHHSPSNIVQKALSLFTLPANQEEIIHNGSTITEGFYPAANLAVRNEVFKLAEGFNEALKYGEDHELCYKIYKTGHKIKAVTGAVVEHIHRKSMGPFLKQSFGFGTAHSYDLKYLSGGRIVFMSPFLKINKAKPGIFIWIDLNQADKKFLALFILGLIWWPLFALCFAYSIHLCFYIKKRLRNNKMTGSIGELPLLSLLLILKSLSLTAGRICHGFKHRALCF